LTVQIVTGWGTVIEATSRHMPNGGWITVSENVTARLRTEEALREQNLRFDAALANMAQGLSMFDADQRLTVCNEQYLKMFGMDPEFVKPGIKLQDALKHCIDRGVFADSGLDALLAQRLEALASNQTRVFPFELAGGRTVSSTLCPMSNGGWSAPSRTSPSAGRRRPIASQLLPNSARSTGASTPRSTTWRTDW